MFARARAVVYARVMVEEKEKYEKLLIDLILKESQDK